MGGERTLPKGVDSAIVVVMSEIRKLPATCGVAEFRMWEAPDGQVV